MSPLRVLVLHNRYRSDQPSGENVVVDLEIELLRESGVEVIEYQRSSDEIDGYSAGQRVSLAARPIYAADSVAAVRRLVEHHRPHVVHLHNPYPLLSPAVLRTARHLGVATVLTVHNYRLVCAKGTFFRDGLRCHDCEGKKLPLPAVLHACYRSSRPQTAVLGTALAVHRNTWRGVDRFIALTSAMASFLERNGAAADRIVVKPNTVRDPGAPSITGREGFIFAGRLASEKGVDLLIEAWDRHPTGSLGTLRIVGDGALQPEVIAFAARRADVEYLGQRAHHDVQQLLARAAVVVVPSRWDEVCPMIVVEAMANGCPVLATERGGLPDLVGPDAGWLVDVDATRLAAGLATAAAQAAAATAAARSRYLELFAPAPVVDRLIKTYEEARERAAVR